MLDGDGVVWWWLSWWKSFNSAVLAVGIPPEMGYGKCMDLLCYIDISSDMAYSMQLKYFHLDNYISFTLFRFVTLLFHPSIFTPTNPPQPHQPEKKKRKKFTTDKPAGLKPSYKGLINHGSVPNLIPHRRSSRSPEWRLGSSVECRLVAQRGAVCAVLEGG